MAVVTVRAADLAICSPKLCVARPPLDRGSTRGRAGGGAGLGLAGAAADAWPEPNMRDQKPCLASGTAGAAAWAGLPETAAVSFSYADSRSMAFS